MSDAEQCQECCICFLAWNISLLFTMLERRINVSAYTMCQNSTCCVRGAFAGTYACFCRMGSCSACIAVRKTAFDSSMVLAAGVACLEQDKGAGELQGHSQPCQCSC